ncbi:MAG: FeoB-associated Cys-rich membrane protein [Candidatus Eisenbacteria bacterium]|nr:FeoB-associated Cys-rich membrane protein [Candidatus Eisenbacteria bacterium]
MPARSPRGRRGDGRPRGVQARARSLAEHEGETGQVHGRERGQSVIERVILGAILVAALLAAALLFRRSYRRARTGGGCAGCPLSDSCASFSENRLDGARCEPGNTGSEDCLDGASRKPGDTESESRLNGGSREPDADDEGERA